MYGYTWENVSYQTKPIPMFHLRGADLLVEFTPVSGAGQHIFRASSTMNMTMITIMTYHKGSDNDSYQ